MTATEIVKSPPMAPGAGMAGAIKRAVKVAVSPTVTFAATDFPSTAMVTVPLFHVPAGITVVDLVLKISTAWDGTGNTLIVGDEGDSDRYLTSAVSLSTDAGVKRALYTGAWYTYSSDNPVINAYIEVSSTTAAGEMVAYLLYTE